MSKRYAEYLAILFFVIIIGVVFQQIATSMTEQGIASGSPYDNAAAYPNAVAVLMGILICVQAILSSLSKSNAEKVPIKTFRKPMLLLVTFAIFLFALGKVGYHLATTPMLMVLLWLAGYRNLFMALIYGLAISFGFAFLFEVFLNIVLPGGIWRLNIPW
jgi:putative tricarboxylic transport membrane protein